MAKLEKIRKSFEGRTVLEDVTLEIPENGVLRIDGPSGRGKSTLLSIIAGLLPPDGGERTGFENMRIAYAFQEDRLLPWFSALDNAALAGERTAARLVLERLGFSGEDMMKKPAELSGGMRRRVNIARALTAPRDLLILDEPMQGLDREMRVGTLLPIIKSEAARIPVVLVTHNMFEEEEKVYSKNVYKLL